MIQIKSEQEINLIRQAGKKLARILDEIKKQVRPGVTTAQLDKFTEELIIKLGARPAFKGYRGFPANICASINEEIVHGIPGNRVIKDGDIVSIDVGIKLDGYFADAAFTMPLGRVNNNLNKLIDITRKALFAGIKNAKVDNYLSDISCSIQNLVESNGFSVVRDFVGHGIGKMMHEDPEIPNFGRPKTGPKLKAGMVFAIEPMVNMGTWEIELLDNGWTAVTKDRKPSAHFEHTIAITENGPQILTE